MLFIINGDKQIERDKAYKNIGRATLEIDDSIEDKIGVILSHIDSIDLWGDNSIIYIINLISDKDFREFIYDNLEKIKNSDNKFVIDEVNINTATLTKLKPYATAVYNALMPPTPEISPFLLCDYIAIKDKRRAWIELQRLYSHGIGAESLHGAIWWKVKTIWSSSKYTSIQKDIIPIGEKYSYNDIQTLSYDLIMIPLRAHNGECDFKNEIEKWVLSIDK